MITLLTSGNWARDQVHATWGADSRLRHPEVERLIEKTWAAAIARHGIHLFDGSICRLESWAATDQSLNLVLSKTSYKVFYGTHLANPHVAATYGKGVLANSVGLSAALLTADGFLMMGRRSASVAYYPSRIHPFAGALEPSEGNDPFAAIQRELAEELNFQPADIAEIRCIGIVEDPALHHPELIFRVTSARTRSEIEKQVDAVEHVGAWAIPATREAVEQAIANPELTPVGVGSLLLWKKSQRDDPTSPPSDEPPALI